MTHAQQCLLQVRIVPYLSPSQTLNLLHSQHQGDDQDDGNEPLDKTRLAKFTSMNELFVTPSGV